MTALLWLGVAACERPGNGELLADFEALTSASISAPRVYASAPAAASASASASAAPDGSASASPSASAASSASKPAAKTYDCGSKGKPDCPMQRWMKSVAGSAVASGDNARLARAFQAMSKAPPGMGGWAGISAQGAALANAGDFDGAKAQCKVCHGKYQSSYRARMRDMPWP